ncbi:MAG TPA: hypothetical protein VE197_12255 [Mycobacterium sp.]|jgi:hypothetical protein|nr:hypothetical protein [Mycobacterium sp.]
MAEQANLPKHRQGFYDAWLRPNRTPGPHCPYHLDPKPGWQVGLMSAQVPSSFQFRWPKLQVGGDLTCTEARSPVNPAGVPPLRGHNFDALFETLVPRPEICPGTTSASGGRVAHGAGAAQARPLRRAEGLGIVKDAACRGLAAALCGEVRRHDNGGGS